MPIGWLKWAKFRIVVALVVGFAVGSCGATKSEATSRSYYRALYQKAAQVDQPPAPITSTKR